MRLKVTTGPDRGRAFRLPDGQTIVIGRGRTAAIRLTDPHVSRVHCQIRTEDQQAILADCNSTAGTLVNGQRIDQWPLKSGDVIGLGATQMRFEAGSAADTSSSTGETIEVDVPPAPANELDDLAGKTISCYHLLEVLAHGKSGTVFRAVNVESGQFVAIRVLRPAITHDAAAMRYFVEAMKAMFPIRHRNIVSIYHANRSGPYWWTAMELIEGESLRAAIARVRAGAAADWRRAQQLAHDVATALDVAERHGIVHGRLAPQNILIRQSDGVVKVNDLMQAAALARTPVEELAPPGPRALAYRAPEQVRSAGQADRRADIYSLGAVVYALLAGHPPFQARSVKELVAKICNDPPPRPSSLGVRLPEPFEAAVLRMLEKSPEARYQRPAELVEAMSHLDQ